MAFRSTLHAGPVSVTDYRCDIAPGTAPFVEWHGGYSVSYVRKGSFGCTTRGRSHELVAGSVMIGFPGDEFVCTHDHTHGDECLSIRVAPELVEQIGDGGDDLAERGAPAAARAHGAWRASPGLRCRARPISASTRRRSARHALRRAGFRQSATAPAASGRRIVAAPSMPRSGSMRTRSEAVELATHRVACRRQRFSFPADVRGRRRRDAAPVPGARPAAPRRAAACRRRPLDHRRRRRSRLRRPVELRAHVPPRRGRVAAPLPAPAAHRTARFSKIGWPPSLGR